MGTMPSDRAADAAQDGSSRKSRIMSEAQTSFHNLVGKLPDAGYLRQFFGAHRSEEGNPTHLLLVDILVVVLWLTLFYPIWIYPVLHGIEAARRAGRSPKWMWFGVHPLFGWITYLLLRAKARAEPTSVQLDAPTQEVLCATARLFGGGSSGQGSQAPGHQARSVNPTPQTGVPERCKELVRQLWDDCPILITEKESDQIEKALDELAQLSKTNEAIIPYLANVLETRRPNVDLGCRQERVIMIALAWTGNERALPVLEKQLMRPDDRTTRIWDIWEAAAFALGQTKSPRAIDILKKGIEAKHALSKCHDAIEKLDPSAAVAEAAPLPVVTNTAIIQEFDRLTNLTSSALAQALAAMPIESKQDAQKFLRIAVGNNPKQGDLNATLGTLIDCMLSHRTGEGRIVIRMSKRSDGVAHFPYEPKQWLQLTPEPDLWNHAIIRVGQDEYLIATH